MVGKKHNNGDWSGNFGIINIAHLFSVYALDSGDQNMDSNSLSQNLYADIREDISGTADTVGLIFNREVQQDRPLYLYVSGTNFLISVWKALLEIPPGSVTSYTQVANRVVVIIGVKQECMQYTPGSQHGMDRNWRGSGVLTFV